MSKTSVEVDAKTPDAFLKQSKTLVDWLSHHASSVALTVGVLVVAGAIYSLWSYWSDRQETQWQEALFPLEKAYATQKEKFEKGKNPPAPSAKAPSDEGVKASGDLQKDYGTIVADFEKFIKEHPHSVAARVAALNLTEIYQEYHQTEKALEVLSWVQPKSAKDLTSALVLYRTASLQADQKDCVNAQKNLDQIVDKKEFEFLVPEVRLQKGLCYELQSDWKAAEEQYSKASSGDQNSAAARTAEKYLRLVQIKKNQSTGS